jgi:CxxC-x17-CxxC domain-containing protein
MPRFERSKGRESRGRNDKPRRRESNDSGSYEKYSKNKRDSRGRDSRGGRGRSFGRERRAPLEMTKVICDSCKAECEVPFKPSSSKPVYCSDCFSKNDSRRGSGSNGRSNSTSDRSLDIINEKLNKIMKALKID